MGHILEKLVVGNKGEKENSGCGGGRGRTKETLEDEHWWRSNQSDKHRKQRQ